MLMNTGSGGGVVICRGSVWSAREIGSDLVEGIILPKVRIALVLDPLPTSGALHSCWAVGQEVLCFQTNATGFSVQRSAVHRGKKSPHIQEHPRFPGRMGRSWPEPARESLPALCSLASCWWI